MAPSTPFASPTMGTAGDDLADLGRVDVDVDDFGVRGELGDLAGHAVGEARAHGDEQVALGDGHVGVLGAVHAHGPRFSGLEQRMAPLPMSVVTTGICMRSASSVSSEHAWLVTMPPPA